LVVCPDLELVRHPFRKSPGLQDNRCFG
jgi:hypothetical protein